MNLDVGPLRRLLRYAAPHRRRLRLASAISVLNEIFDGGPPVLVGAAFDGVVRRSFERI